MGALLFLYIQNMCYYAVTVALVMIVALLLDIQHVFLYSNGRPGDDSTLLP